MLLFFVVLGGGLCIADPAVLFSLDQKKNNKNDNNGHVLESPIKKLAVDENVSE